MEVPSGRIPRSFVRSASLAIALVAACSGCSTYLGTTPKSFLRHVRSNPDPNLRFIAYSKLGNPDLYDDPNDRSEVVKTLVAKLDEGKEPLAIRAVIVRTLGVLGDRRARNSILRIVQNAQTEPMLKVEAYRALGKVGTPEDAMTLVRIMNTDQLEDCRIAAIEGIGALKSKDPRIYHVLIEGMDHADPAIRLECYRALKQITGKDLGNRPENWQKELEPQLAAAAPPPAAGSASTSSASAVQPQPKPWSGTAAITDPARR